jgi:hypothetical protein
LLHGVMRFAIGTGAEQPGSSQVSVGDGHGRRCRT